MRLESLFSAPVSVMATDLLAPAQVLGLGFTVEQGKVLLNWDPTVTNSDGSELIDLAGYKVFRKKAAGDEFVELGQTGAGEVSFEDNTMKDGASYVYAVAAFDDQDAEGAKSSALDVKTIPSVPTGLASNASDRKIILNWTSVQNELDLELNENLAGYNVYRQDAEGEYVAIATVDAATETFEDADIVIGNTYTYVVTAFDNSPE